MAILVTGGAGFIGSHVCEALVKEGKEAVCLDNFNEFYNPKFKQENIKGLLKERNFKLIKGDIREKNVERILKKNYVREVIHLAAQAGVRPSIENPMLYADVNINGTLNLLEASRRQGI